MVFWDQVSEETGVDGRLQCKEGAPPDEWDAPIEPCDLYGPGNGFDVITNESQTRLAEPQTRLTADEEEA